MIGIKPSVNHIQADQSDLLPASDVLLASASPCPSSAVLIEQSAVTGFCKLADFIMELKSKKSWIGFGQCG